MMATTFPLASIPEVPSIGSTWTRAGNSLVATDPSTTLSIEIDPSINGENELFEGITSGKVSAGQGIPLRVALDSTKLNQKQLIEGILTHGLATLIVLSANKTIDPLDICLLKETIERGAPLTNSVRILSEKIKQFFRLKLCSLLSETLIARFAFHGYRLRGKTESRFFVCSYESFKVISTTTMTTLSNKTNSHKIDARATATFLLNNDEPQFEDVKIHGLPSFLNIVEAIFEEEEEKADFNFDLLSLDYLLNKELPSEAESSQKRGLQSLIKTLLIWQRLKDKISPEIATSLFSVHQKNQAFSSRKHRKRRKSRERQGSISSLASSQESGSPSKGGKRNISASSIPLPALTLSPEKRARRSSVFSTASLPSTSQKEKTLKFLYKVCDLLKGFDFIGKTETTPLSIDEITTYLDASFVRSRHRRYKDAVIAFYAYLLLNRMEKNDPTSLVVSIAEASSAYLSPLLERAIQVMQKGERNALEFGIRHLSSLIQNWEKSLASPQFIAHLKKALESLNRKQFIATTDEILKYFFIRKIDTEYASEIFPRIALLSLYSWKSALSSETMDPDAIALQKSFQSNFVNKFPEASNGFSIWQFNALRSALLLFMPSESPYPLESSPFQKIWHHVITLLHSDEPSIDAINQIATLTTLLENWGFGFDGTYKIKALKFQISLAKNLAERREELRQENYYLPTTFRRMLGIAQYARLLGFEGSLNSYTLFKDLADREKIEESTYKETLETIFSTHPLGAPSSIPLDKIEETFKEIEETRGFQKNWIVYPILLKFIESEDREENPETILSLLSAINRDQLETETFLSQKASTFDTLFSLAAFVTFYDELPKKSEGYEQPFCHKLFFGLEEKNHLSIILIKALQYAFLLLSPRHEKGSLSSLRLMHNFRFFEETANMYLPKDLSKERALLDDRKQIQKIEKAFLSPFQKPPSLTHSNIANSLRALPLLLKWENIAHTKWKRELCEFLESNKRSIKNTTLETEITKRVEEGTLPSAWGEIFK